MISVFGYGVLCFVIGMFIGPALINAGLLECAIAAALKNVHSITMHSFHLKVRILVMSAYQVVYNLFTGWFCAEGARVSFFSKFLNIVPVFIAIGLSGAIILLIAIALLLRTSCWDKYVLLSI